MTWGNKKNFLRRVLFTVTAVIVLLTACHAKKAHAPAETGNTCTVTIRCDTILENMEALDPEKRDLIPADGVILPETEVTVSDGDSTFDVLKRACLAGRIHLEFSEAAFYDSVYIEGIANIYEFDCGPLSGWMFCINGEYKNYGCSAILVSPGDRVDFNYTCDLGCDLGNGVSQ